MERDSTSRGRSNERADGSERPGSSRGLVELHLHLEGALTAERALRLYADRSQVGPPPEGGISGQIVDAAVPAGSGSTTGPNQPATRTKSEGSTPAWHFEDLGGFLRLFGWATHLLDGPEAYGELLADTLRDLDTQGVVYAELFVALGQMHLAGSDPTAVVPHLAALARDHADSGGVDVRFIADATRQWGVAAADRVLDDALELREHRVVGFGMGGAEFEPPLSAFASTFARAAEEGLGISCHAGEAGDSAAVRQAVELLGVSRIGHGIAAVQDEALVDLLVERGITLEVCPTSNLRTGAWRAEMGPHPVLRLASRGVGIVLGSDDPAFFDSNLSGERRLCHDWGVTEGQLDAWNLQAAHSAFLTPGERETLLTRISVGGPSETG